MVSYPKIPKILVLDTSTDACTVGLLIEGKVLQLSETAPREHTRLLLPMVQSILNEAQIELCDLDALACTIGPGSFTGVRIGTALVQGFSFAVNKPVILISTLRAIAQEAFQLGNHRKVFAYLDAGQKEIYGACFLLNEQGIMQAMTKEALMNPNNITLPEPEADWVRVKDLPKANSLLQIAKVEFENGNAVSAEKVQPNYGTGSQWDR